MSRRLSFFPLPSLPRRAFTVPPCFCNPSRFPPLLEFVLESTFIFISLSRSPPLESPIFFFLFLTRARLLFSYRLVFDFLFFVLVSLFGLLFPAFSHLLPTRTPESPFPISAFFSFYHPFAFFPFFTPSRRLSSFPSSLLLICAVLSGTSCFPLLIWLFSGFFATFLPCASSSPSFPTSCHFFFTIT